MRINLVSALILVLTIQSFYNKAYCQATSAGIGNIPSTIFPNFDYIGWAAGSNAILATGGTLIIPDLSIKTEDPMPISFYTNAGNGGFSNLRMWIKDDGGGTTTTDSRNNDGFVGIGDFSTFTGSSTTPQELLHLPVVSGLSAGNV